jgi:hypothetical protein
MEHPQQIALGATYAADAMDVQDPFRHWLASTAP